MAEAPSVREAVQRNENTRKNSFLNYALTAELQAHICCKTNHANGGQPRPKRFRLLRPTGPKRAQQVDVAPLAPLLRFLGSMHPACLDQLALPGDAGNLPRGF
jgi:hypothetical protein